MFDPPAKRSATARRGGCFVSFLFAILFLAGTVILWEFFREPWALYLSARSWESVPCTVIASRLEPIAPDSKGRPLKRRLDFRYAYSYRGEIYRSTNVWFIKPDMEESKRLVQRYPRDTATVCWVNPRNPSEAYLLRSFRAELLLALFPLALAMIGLIGIAGQVGRRLRTPPPARLFEDED